MKRRSPILALLLTVALPLTGVAACSNDSGSQGTNATAEPVASSAAPATTGSVPGPTTTAAAQDPTPATTGSGELIDDPPPPTPEPQPDTQAKPTPTPAPKKVTKVDPEPPAPKPTEPKTKVPSPTPPPAQVAPPPTPKPVELSAPKKGSADEIASKIDAIFKPTKRFKALFDQKYTAKVHGKEKKSRGLVYVEKPGKLSLKYQAPNRNRAVSDGTTLKVYEHDNKQMFVKPVRNTEYPGAFAFILGKGLRHSFTFEFHENSKWEGGPVLVGTPRVANPGYTKVFFYIDQALLDKGDLGCMRRVLVIDAQGNRNRFDFVKASEPKSIKSKIFEFTPPSGTQIIKG